MKINQRTIKVYDTSHKIASQLSQRYRMSMAALVELGLRTLADQPKLVIHPLDARSEKSNARTILKGRKS